MPKYRRIHITPTLTTVIGAFVFITAALVLFVQASTSERVVRNLGGELINVGMRSLERAFVSQVEAIAEAAEFTAEALHRGSILPQRPQEVAEYLFGSLAAMEHVSFVIVTDADGNFVQIERGAGDAILVPKFVPASDYTHHLSGLISKSLKAEEPFWTDPIYFSERQHTYIARVFPVRSEGKSEGLVIIAMSMHRLSEITHDISNDIVTVFLMRPGTVDLIAHPQLSEVFDKLAPHDPLVDVDHVPDEFLATLRSTQMIDPKSYGIGEEHELRVGYDKHGHKRFIILETGAHGPAGLPVSIGAHFTADILDQPLHQLFDAILIGIALLGLSLIGAGFLAHRIGKPIRRAAVGARAVARLDLDRVPELKSSYVRELDDLSTGFNSMVSGLRAFRRYVPKTLVLKLLSEGRAEAPPEEREVAVLFTDIAGFTAISEGMSATETADFVNEHLTLVGASIRKHGGTIDKYIGDSLMAFWGAPEKLESPARAAALAALDIAADIHTDNERRKQRGLAPVRIRIGVHTGPLVVGDIGAPERVNYTVIGDTVNVAARLESLGKEIDSSAEVIVLVSGEVASALDTGNARQAIGPQKVKGRDEAVEVVRLMPS